MRTKKLLLMLVLGLPLPALAQSDYAHALNSVLDFTCYDGSLIYDWLLEPQKTDQDRAGLMGNIERVVVTHKDYTDGNFIVMNHLSDTLWFNTDGMLVAHRYPKSDSYSPHLKFMPGTWRYEVEGTKRLSAVFEEDTENANFPDLVFGRNSYTYQYDAQGRLTRVMEKVSHRENGTMVETHQGFTQHPWAEFVYDGNGQVVSGQRSHGDETLTYQEGRLVKIVPTNGGQPVTFTRDERGRIVSISTRMLDGMDEEEYFERVCTLAYNEWGDISRVDVTMWNTTESWKRQSVAYKNIYNVTYVYDALGNWTKAVMKGTIDGATKTVYESTRAIDYR